MQVYSETYRFSLSLVKFGFVLNRTWFACRRFCIYTQSHDKKNIGCRLFLSKTFRIEILWMLLYMYIYFWIGARKCILPYCQRLKNTMTWGQRTQALCQTFTLILLNWIKQAVFPHQRKIMQCAYKSLLPKKQTIRSLKTLIRIVWLWMKNEFRCAMLLLSKRLRAI